MAKAKKTVFNSWFSSKSPDNEGFDAFISYRRETASDLASLLKIQLENQYHKRIFLDVKELQVGRFDEMLLTRIEETPNFILILSKNSLDHCSVKTDWLKREVVQAIKTGRNIIPVLTKNFSYPSEEEWQDLPPEMQVLQSLNGINYNHEYQDPAIEKIVSYMKSAKSVPPVQFVPGPVEKKKPAEKTEPVQTGSQEEIPENVNTLSNPESIIFLKRGEKLTVDTRDSKVRSVYYGPGTALQYAEKGKGEIYPWYRFCGADGRDYWLEGPGPVDTIDRRVFFRINETGQVGYMVELLGERTDPWGSLEEFKIDDDIVGPTVVRFDQIVSMTSQNGVMSVQKKAGVITGSLQKMANYDGGSYTKGPCIVTCDAVIPLLRSNRVGPMTVTRIDESEKPPLVTVPIYGGKSQLKFISQANPVVGHFDEITPDIYIQLDEKALGRMRISIPRIVSISVDPESKEAPVTVETTEGSVYQGICLDPFNSSGSVFTFDKVKKSLRLISTIPGLPNAAEQDTHPLTRPQPVPGKPAAVSNVDDQSWFMKTTEGPGQRSDFGMAYDDKQELIILHGGFGQGNAGNRPSGMPALYSMSPEQHDTWTWDGSSWRLLSNSSPALVSHALAYCKKTQQNVISGGWSGSRRMNDTYILTGDTWTKAENGIEFYKGGFQNHAMAYDEKRKTIILFGGLTVMFPGGQIPLGETWEWNGLAWSRLDVNGPEPRWGHKMVYDHSMGAILLFGGEDGKKYFDDTWIWKGNEASWKKLSVDSAPSGRSNHAMACDILSGRVLMFGGLSESKTPLNDLWGWNGSKWTVMMEQTPPKPRYNHGFVYDIKRKKSILFGGFDGKEFFRDTWEFGF